MGLNEIKINQIVSDDLLNIYNSVNLIKEPKIPFPQADVFEVFIDICETLFKRGSLSRGTIMEVFNLKPRQYSFYKSAGEYLGLIKSNHLNLMELSEKGLGIFAFEEKEKKLGIVRLILQHKPFYEVFSIYVDEKRVPNKEEIFNVLKRNVIYNIDSDVTLKRRSSTVYNWIKWIIGLGSEKII